jgi:hypothetical protein
LSSRSRAQFAALGSVESLAQAEGSAPQLKWLAMPQPEQIPRLHKAPERLAAFDVVRLGMTYRWIKARIEETFFFLRN